jgi:hypothetical protein
MIHSKYLKNELCLVVDSSLLGTILSLRKTGITEKISCPRAFKKMLSISGVCRTQDLGRPASCRHVFCLTCIREWAKVCLTSTVNITVYCF